MRYSRSLRIAARRRRGAMVLLVLFMLVALLATAAFSVDVAYMQLARTELRRATDAAARAGMEALHRTEDAEAVIEAVQRIAEQNLVAGEPLLIRDDQIVLGKVAQGDDGKWHFQPWEEPYNSVQVVGSRAKESASGSITLFFGRMLGTEAFEPEMETIASQNPDVKRDFALVVDRSGSMRGPAAGGGGLSRWESLLGAVGGFFGALDDTEDEELVGLASYSNNSAVDHWLTDLHSSVQGTLGSIRPNGWTNIHSGIQNGISILTDGRARDEATKIMVVMTDGRHNTGPEPVIAARRAAASDITIYTITFGNDADIRRMQAVADATGGKHYHAPTAAKLRDVFQQVVNDSAGLVFVQ